MTKTIERKGRKARKGLTLETPKELFFAALAAFAFFVISAAPASPQPPAPATVTPSGNAQNGKELYATYSCYACHGYDGHGGAGARLVPMRMNLPGFSAYIKNPRQMPPYTAKVLSDAQAADLWAYIKAMPESPAADKIPLLSRIMSEK
ncbi:MAG: hypothetical protein AUH43_15925 [Acidobacteria bacterium 13_1_40CM_65_14]|nr:MAG: hypothetical protein AUH43_15925 [Acidobacteria bacterium 13_1_40CM_65_14]